MRVRDAKSDFPMRHALNLEMKTKLETRALPCNWKVVGHEGNTKQLGQFMPGPFLVEPAGFVGVKES